MNLRIGVLALQGDVREHLRSLARLDCIAAPVKRANQIGRCDGLIIPGGESTTMGKLLERFELGEAIRDLHARRVPIYGTCAGMILLAREITDSDQWRLGLMDMRVARNAFGRQVDSFEADINVSVIPGPPVRGVFIRAPYVESLGESVEVLATFRDRIVMVRQGTLLASAFHPELTSDGRIHQYFLDMCRPAAQQRG